ncbi:AtpZ/AtpI family protein [Paenibacillus sp. NFR01]|uniref:AtpZ/AtpI family protein n=1 Tax=Paenibacillus sp. NFR01 TaxID=1566279 RepID=UPI0008CD939D|nr:AtpZ/AtpI family protein [Paenibacillus sp. NFR01]SEU13559.1 hypothetical protein SAMN03159358_3532 [Paenibacillus sp. NFR01]
MNQSDRNQNEGKDPARAYRAIGLASAIGVDLAGCTIGGYFLGRWLGGMWGNAGLWVGLGVLFGMLSGAASIVSVIKRVMRESDE